MNERAKIYPELTPSQEGDRSESILKNNRRFWAEKARQLGVPVDDDLRVSMKESGLPKEVVEKDLREVERAQSIKYQGLSRKERIGKKVAEEYEIKLGDLAVIIFNKHLGSGFLTVKTSPYDQLKNEANIMILDARTGDLICAINGVGSLEDSENKQKMIQTFRKNVAVDKNGNSGSRLEYGMAKGSGGKLIIGEKKNLPTLFLGEEKNRIDSGLRNLMPPEQKSEKEEELFIRFLFCLGQQLDKLAAAKHLNPELKNNLAVLRDFYQRYNINSRP